MKAYVTFLAIVDGLPDDMDDKEIEEFARDYDALTLLDIEREYKSRTNDEIKTLDDFDKKVLPHCKEIG